MAEKKKEIKTTFHRDSNNCVCTTIYLVNKSGTKRYMASFAAAPEKKVLKAKSDILTLIGEWLHEHPEWVRVEKEVYETVKVSQ